MIIYPSKKIIDNKYATLTSTINFLDTETDLYFKTQNIYSNFVTELLDPFLIALLIPAMSFGTDITVKGSISKNLFLNLQDQVQDILCNVINGLSKVNISVSNIVDKPIQDKINVLSGFSAGVDAFVTFDDYYLNTKSNLKISHFLFNNLTYGDVKIRQKIFNINNLVQKYSFPLMQTWSNLHSFYKKGKKIGFEQTHTMRNAAIPHFLAGVPNTFLYSSTFHKDLIEIKRSHDLAIVDDILLPLLSSSDVDCMSVGSEYTRLDKTFKVANLNDAYNYLDTCIGKQFNPYINCGTCRKCTRALLTFELADKINNFKNIFNLDAWYDVKKDYLLDLPNRTQLNDYELYTYIEKNFKDILQ